MLEVKKINKIQMIKNTKPADVAAPSFLSEQETATVRRYHQSIPAYGESPLVELKALAKKLGVASILVKDESTRFGLNAFKGLGGTYALCRVICEKLGLDPETVTLEQLKAPECLEKIQDMVFITTTDGNHGKGVSWAAGLLGCQAHVYMPKNSVEVRAQAIRDAGKAEVTITNMTYDECVRYTARLAEENGWILVQDTSWPGYEKIPTWIVQGYSTMAFEAMEQMEALGYEKPTHVFLQAGVGAMAGGVLGTMVCKYQEDMPVVSIVEPDEVACIFESARQADQAPHMAIGSEITIMAGLNCAEPCQVTWPVLRDYSDYYFACPDEVTMKGMRTLGLPEGNDPVVVSGESGAVTTGLAALLLEEPEYEAFRKELGFDETSVILVFSTEGDTDPEGYEKVVGR